MSPATPRGRLRRADCSSPGLRRVRRGRGFAYLDERGHRLDDPEEITRLRELAIPPAWQDVWICPDPLGHLQATGIDAAGRKQYLYHPRWREHRDRAKYEKMVRFGQRLAPMRRHVVAVLTEASEPTHDRILACAVRLLDVGLFRIGSEEYADEEGGLGLATVRREHVKITAEGAVFDYLGKGGIRRVHRISDPASLKLVTALRRRRGGPDELLAYRDGRRWRGVRSEEINEYLKEEMGEDFSAKDFRTWNATVLAAVSLAVDGRGAGSQAARKRATNRAVRAVAGLLGNTPAVARRSYIDPRVFDRYLSGWTIAGEVERIGDLETADDAIRERLESGVLDLLADERSSPALAREPAAA